MISIVAFRWGRLHRNTIAIMSRFSRNRGIWLVSICREERHAALRMQRMGVPVQTFSPCLAVEATQ